MSIPDMIAALSAERDRYGYPHLLGFMETYHLTGLVAATSEQLQEYKYLGGKNHGNYHNERDSRI